MKTFPLMISRTFMKSHPKAGQNTLFREKIEQSVLGNPRLKYPKVSPGEVYIGEPIMTMCSDYGNKIHTIRGNYAHWAHVAEEVNSGRGVLSLRQWTGSPYNRLRDSSKQEEFMRLSEMHVQRIEIQDHRHPADLDKEKNIFVDVDGKSVGFQTLAKNDGLDWSDLFHWFGGKPGKRMPPFEGCVVQFTDFKYL